VFSVVQIPVYVIILVASKIFVKIFISYQETDVLKTCMFLRLVIRTVKGEDLLHI
jgi:hypothetical protein